MNHRAAILLPAGLVGVVQEGDPSLLPSAYRGAAVTAEPESPALRPSGEAEQERETFRKVLRGLADAVQRLNTLERQPLEELQQLAIELGVAIAGRLVHEKTSAGEFGIESLVRGAIERLHSKNAVTIRLHPEDMALLERRLGGDFAMLHAEQPVQFRADGSLGRGDCKVQAGDVSVWSSLQKQLWEIRDMLLEGLPGVRGQESGVRSQESGVNKRPDL